MILLHWLAGPPRLKADSEDENYHRLNYGYEFQDLISQQYNSGFKKGDVLTVRKVCWYQIGTMRYWFYTFETSTWLDENGGFVWDPYAPEETLKMRQGFLVFRDDDLERYSDEDSDEDSDDNGICEFCGQNTRGGCLDSDGNNNCNGYGDELQQREKQKWARYARQRDTVYSDSE